MGNCWCFARQESSDPMLDREARARAAEAAEQRLQSYEQSAAGRAAKKAQANAEREKAASRNGRSAEPLRWD